MSPAWPGHPVSPDAVRQAAVALRGVVARTPLLENADANACLGGRLLLRVESTQRAGAFKIGGADNCIRQLTDAERARGAITHSPGNHALDVALAARLADSSALIVMPGDVPPAKVQAVRDMGAEVVTVERDTETSDDTVARLKPETGRVEVPPSADLRVLAGAGTAAPKLSGQARTADATLDAVLIPCGGGGLTASDDEVRNAIRFAFRHSRIVVEPGAAVGLAAILRGQIEITGKTIATVITGGNIDATRSCAMLHENIRTEGR